MVRAMECHRVQWSTQSIAEYVDFLEHCGVREVHGTPWCARSAAEYAKYCREPGSMWRAQECAEYAEYEEYAEHMECA